MHAAFQGNQLCTWSMHMWTPAAELFDSLSRITDHLRTSNPVGLASSRVVANELAGARSLINSWILMVAFYRKRVQEFMSDSYQCQYALCNLAVVEGRLMFGLRSAKELRSQVQRISKRVHLMYRESTDRHRGRLSRFDEDLVCLEAVLDILIAQFSRTIRLIRKMLVISSN